MPSGHAAARASVPARFYPARQAQNSFLRIHKKMRTNTDICGALAAGCGTNTGRMWTNTDMKNKDSGKTIQDCRHADLSLSPLAALIMKDLDFWKRRTITDLVSRTRASRSTVKLRLRELVRDGHAQMHGRGKATWYTL